MIRSLHAENMCVADGLEKRAPEGRRFLPLQASAALSNRLHKPLKRAIWREILLIGSVAHIWKEV